MIDFENPFEDQYDEFFRRYFDLSDNMMEFQEKWRAKSVDTVEIYIVI